MKFNCLLCGAVLSIEGDHIKLATTECCECNFTMLIEDNKVYDFHAKMHECNSLWPKDGKGTGSVEIAHEEVL